MDSPIEGRVRSRSPRIHRRYPSPRSGSTVEVTIHGRYPSPRSRSTVEVTIHDIFEIGGAEGPFEMIMEGCVGPLPDMVPAWYQCMSWQAVCKGWQYAFWEYNRDIDD